MISSGDEAFPWAAVIEGEPASKANSRRQVPRRTKTGRIFIASIKSAKALSFSECAVQTLALRRPKQPFECDLIMECRIWYASRRPDLDASLVEDSLQRAGIIFDDRQLREKHLYWGLDRDRPRVLVVLTRRATA